MLAFDGRPQLPRFLQNRFAGRLRRHPGRTVLVVAHGGSLRVLVCCLTGQDVSAWRQLQVDRASLSVIDLRDHGGVVRVLNDVSHLGEEGERR